MGGSVLEVEGKAVVRQPGGFSEFANQPGSMLEVEEARVRVHGHRGAGVWETVEGVSLNCDRVVLLVPLDGADPGLEPDLAGEHQMVRAKLFMVGIEVTGFVATAVQDTVANLLEESRARFVRVAEARLFSGPDRHWLDDRPDGVRFCLVNRRLVTACIETRPGAD